MWYLWFFTSIAYFFVYAENDIYAMMLLQIYNAVICIYGIFQWKRSKKQAKKIHNGNGEDDSVDLKQNDVEREVLVIRSLSALQAVISIFISVIVFIAMAIVLERYTNDASPWLDSLVTTLCMLATYYLSRQNIANWIVWILCNLISVYLYWSLDMIPTSILYVIYVGMAIWGYYHWKRKGVKID